MAPSTNPLIIIIQLATIRYFWQKLGCRHILFITVAPYRDSGSDSEDCYILVVLFIFYLVFSVHRLFDVPGPIFATLCHTTQRVLKYFISYMRMKT